MPGLRVMSNWIRTSPVAGTFRLRMSMTPVPLLPPVLLVALMSAPAGDVTSVSVPGAKSAWVLSASMSSNIRKLLNA